MPNPDALQDLGQQLQAHLDAIADELYTESTTSRSWLSRSFGSDRVLVIALTRIVLETYFASLQAGLAQLDMSPARAALSERMQKLLTGRTREEFIAYLRVATSQFEQIAGPKVDESARETLHRIHPHYSTDLAFWAAEYHSSSQRNQLQAAQEQAIAAQALLAGRLSAIDRLTDLGWSQAKQFACCYSAVDVPPEVTARTRSLLDSAKCKWILYWAPRAVLLLVATDDTTSPSTIIQKIATASGMPGVISANSSTLRGLLEQVNLARTAAEASDGWWTAPALVKAEQLLPEILIRGGIKGNEKLIRAAAVPLMNADPDHVETLRTYLECGGEPRTTAKTLGVHVNTIRYRLRKIKNATGWDLGNPRVAYHLHVILSAKALL